MSPYRATDEQLDREIAAVERIARVRLRRATAELNDLDRELRELRKERARRTARAEAVVSTDVSVASDAPAAES